MNSEILSIRGKSFVLPRTALISAAGLVAACAENRQRLVYWQQRVRNPFPRRALKEGRYSYWVVSDVGKWLLDNGAKSVLYESSDGP